MPVETFSKAEFETALESILVRASLQPFMQGTVAQCTYSARFVKGEWQYLVKVDAQTGIAIRSSVDNNGSSAGAGMDSIRLWLVQWVTESNAVIKFQFTPLGGKLGKYVTRVTGWQERTALAVQALARLRRNAGNCQHCGQPLYIYKVRKEGANHGRLFGKCQCANGADTFVWLDTQFSASLE